MRIQEIITESVNKVVYRMDSKPIEDFSNLNPYKHTDDWSQSGLDTGDDSYWKEKNIDKINPQDCRDWAMANFTMDRIGDMYEHYFQMVMDVHTGKGWYQEHPERKELDWLNRYYPKGVKIAPKA